MRSKASIKGHPIHPALIAFPIAFLAGAFVCDVVGVMLESPLWWTTGAWLALAGIISAVVAAVPGIVDYVYTVPPKSSAKTRAIYHMLVNSGAVLLFVVAWIARGGAGMEPGYAVLLPEAGGLVLLGIGGWLGGTLVYRNLIGVDHRFAEAGKFNEQYFDGNASSPLHVADSNELTANQMKLLHIGERRVVLARTDDGYVAFDDRCTHRGGSLAGGVLMCGKVQCLWHGSQFDVTSGNVHSGPAEKPISTYHVEVQHDKVMLHYST